MESIYEQKGERKRIWKHQCTYIWHSDMLHLENMSHKQHIKSAEIRAYVYHQTMKWKLDDAQIISIPYQAFCALTKEHFKWNYLL